MANTQFVVAPESESLLCGERKTSSEYVVANPLNIEVELKSGEVHRPQEIRERVTRCRDCEHAFSRGDRFDCMHFCQWDDYNDCPGEWIVEPDGFCAWGKPREGGADD